jgi:alpha-galactosidase/6-phospho-beta-glucosidase family protein
MHSLEATGETAELKIGYVGGGSQNWAHTLINDLAKCTDLSGEVALYDVRPEPAERNAELGNRVSERSDTADWTYRFEETLADALDGADFVVCSTQDPPEETFKHDLDVPQEYGIYQPVGDTVGPGGTMRAMRSVPQYREIAATVREQCPDAWVFNYTNTMTVCTRTLYEEYPDINAMGLCHEVYSTQEYLAEIASEYWDVEASDHEVDVNVKGVNHFTFVDEARWRGRDLTPLLDRELDARLPLPRFEPGELDDEPTGVNHRDAAFEFYRRFGLFGAAGDRHLTEFVPWFLDIEEGEEIQRWGLRLTPSSSRVRADGASKTERILAGEERFEIEDSGEEVVNLMRALTGIEPLKTNVNVPNRGQIPDLPEGAVVETNALLTGDAVRPLAAGPFPPELRDLVATHVTNQETLVEAGFDGDVDKAFRAFIRDPLVDIQTDRAAELFRELVELERDYLTDWDLDDADVLN